jgi:hypothetical protein
MAEVDRTGHALVRLSGPRSIPRWSLGRVAPPCCPIEPDWPPRPIRVFSSVPAEGFPPLVSVAPDLILLAQLSELR